MPATVDPLLPLTLFEAVRAVDMPSGEAEAEFVHELRNKRLGLSETVFAQIRRYNEAVKKNQRPPLDEAVALAKLIGRRPDAEAVFREVERELDSAIKLSDRDTDDTRRRLLRGQSAFLLGELYVNVFNDRAKAKAFYQDALRDVPDHDGALEALKRFN